MSNANNNERKVPELSLTSYTKGSPEEQVKFVDTLMFGLKEYGFVILNDHTVDQKKVDEAYDMVKQFFALPVEKKNEYQGENGGQRGYTPFGMEHAKDSEHPDLKEFWHVGRELSADSQYKGIYPENIWPSEVPGFKEKFIDLYESMDATANVLLEAIGKGLDVPEGFFADMVKDGNSILRTIHYPPTDGHDTTNSIRAGAHEDINLITMLVGATSSGLQLLDRDGTWLNVDSKPGQLVVDSGDMMARLTNNVLPATTHRVINPDNSGEERYSMPYFVHPHSKASLACLESCIGEGKKWDDITAGDFLNQRLREIGLIK